MARTIGIDLGTTNSVVAVLDGEKASVIVNGEGNRTTPSVVAYREGGERLAGQAAKRQAVLNPRGTVSSAKRFMGRNLAEVGDEAQSSSVEIGEGPNGAARFKVGKEQVSPEEVSAAILRKLADDATKHLGEKVNQAVITVPAYFNDAQRQATKDAGEIAGLEVLRIINEPTAAALAYGLEKKKHETILVFDLGGGTFDVSILDVGDGVCEVRAAAGDSRLGGDDFDKRIVDWLAEDFRSSHGMDLRSDSQALQRLFEAAEKAKCELSTAPETEIHLPFITADASGPKHLQATLARSRFEALTHDLVDRCLEPLNQALSDAGIDAKELDEVLLVGGSTRIPAVQELVKRLTGGREPNMGVNPDEVVALGAAVQAGVLSGEVEDVLLLDVTPLSLGVETLGGVMTRILDRNTTIPARRSEVFSTAEDNQPAVEIVVLQGEREMAEGNRVLGRFRLEGIQTAPLGVPQIEVAFDIDANGILDVSARDKNTGKEQSVTISGSTGLDRKEVDHMVQEAQRHATEDKAAREKVELRNRAHQLAYHLDRQLEDQGESLPVHEKGRALELIQRLRGSDGNSFSRDELRTLISDLEQMLHMMAPATAQGPHGPQPPPNDVVDAEYV